MTETEKRANSLIDNMNYAAATYKFACDVTEENLEKAAQLVDRIIDSVHFCTNCSKEYRDGYLAGRKELKQEVTKLLRQMVVR